MVAMTVMCLYITGEGSPHTVVEHCQTRVKTKNRGKGVTKGMENHSVSQQESNRNLSVSMGRQMQHGSRYLVFVGNLDLDKSRGLTTTKRSTLGV